MKNMIKKNIAWIAVFALVVIGCFAAFAEETDTIPEPEEIIEETIEDIEEDFEEEEEPEMPELSEEDEPEAEEAEAEDTAAKEDQALKEAYEAYLNAKRDEKLAAYEAELDSMVESGKLTQEQADLLKDAMKKKQEARSNGMSGMKGGRRGGKNRSGRSGCDCMPGSGNMNNNMPNNMPGNGMRGGMSGFNGRGFSKGR